MKASNLVVGGNTSFLFKGPFGFGKTLAAASFALMGPLYLSYWDKKAPIELVTFFTKERFGDKAEKILNNIEYDVYDSTNPNEYLNKLIGFTKDCRYMTHVNDSVTFMTTSSVGWSLNFGKEDHTAKKVKDVLPDFDEYKVETSLVAQCLDLCRRLPCNVIWTAHPIPGIKIEGSGASMRVTKTNPIVSYGSKVAGIVPGAFTEVYHFSQASDWNQATGKSSKRYMCNLEAIGDEFAKSPLLSSHVKELDFTDRLFYEVWKEAIDKSRGIETKETKPVDNPFTKPATQPASNWKV